MKVSSIIKSTIDKGMDSGTQYAKTTLDYYAMSIFFRVAKISTRAVKSSIYGFIGLVALIYFSVAGTLWLADYLENSALACLVVGFVYVAFLFLVRLCHRSIESVVIKYLSEDILKN